MVYLLSFLNTFMSSFILFLATDIVLSSAKHATETSLLKKIKVIYKNIEEIHESSIPKIFIVSGIFAVFYKS